MINFECSNCGKSYNVNDELAGRAAKCQQCGQKITVPLPRPVAASPIPQRTQTASAPLTSYFYFDTDNKQIVVDSKKIKELIINGIITAKTVIGSTNSPSTTLAGKIPQLADAFVEYQRRAHDVQKQASVVVPPQPTVSAPSVPIPIDPVSTFPATVETPPVPAQSNDSVMMMEMMKELIASRNQQPQIVITNTNTNTNTNENTGIGQMSYSLIMGFVVWFFFGWCMGGTCYLGRCSSLIVVAAIIFTCVTAGIAGILFWIIDFIMVLLTALSKPARDCQGRRAIYT